MANQSTEGTEGSAIKKPFDKEPFWYSFCVWKDVGL